MAAKIFILILCVLVIWRLLLVVKPGMVEKFSSEKEKGRKVWTKAFRLFASIRYYSTFLICAFVGFAPTEFFIPSIYHAENGENHLPSWEAVILIFLGGLVASTVISLIFYIAKNALINKYYQNHLNLFDPAPGGFSQFEPPTSETKEGGCSFRFMVPVFCIVALIGSVIEGEASVLKGILAIIGFVVIYSVVLLLLELIDGELEILLSYKEMTKRGVVFIFVSITMTALFVVLFIRDMNGYGSKDAETNDEVGLDSSVRLPPLSESNYDYNKYATELAHREIKSSIKERAFSLTQEENTILYFFWDGERLPASDIDKGFYVPIGCTMEFIVAKMGNDSINSMIYEFTQNETDEGDDNDGWGTDDPNVYFVKPTEGIILRDGPGLEYPRLHTKQKGDLVYFVENANKCDTIDNSVLCWWLVGYFHKGISFEGYCFSNDLQKKY